ncbi:prepilin peptidase [Arthrobacter celericrescens]|uniref:prepilin peptidase n=1 Tax=Arthrobacter celericrescens TaxID=2320851 RepID=UPI001FE020B5|nr:prepilin peptidase [Arthrobacter celericrescens]
MTVAPELLVLAGIAGAGLSLLADLAIKLWLPRLGGMPPLWTRLTTAAVTGLLFVLFAWRFGISPELPAFLALAVLAVQLSRIDIALHLLPNPLVLGLLGAGLALFAASAALGSEWGGLLRAAAGGAVLFAGYLILGLISPRSLGMGDVKLAAPLGMYLGYLGWKQVFYGGLLGFVMGGLLTVLMVRLGRGNTPKETPHGPPMFAAAISVLLLLP